MKILNILLVLLFLAFGAAHSQQQQTAAVNFKLDLTALATLTAEYIEIETKNILFPAELPKKLKVSFRRTSQRDKISIRPGNSYSFKELLGKDLVHKILTINVHPDKWNVDNSHVIFTERDNRLIADLRNLPLTPSKYKITVIGFDGKKAAPLLAEEKEIIAGNVYTIPITTPSFIDGLIGKFITRENLLVSIIAGLLAILIGVLKDSIKKAFEWVLNVLGKYGRGRLADRRFLKRYLDNIIFNHKYLKLVGFNTAGISRPRLEEIFVSLRVSRHDVRPPGQTGAAEDHQKIKAIPFAGALKQYKNLVILGGPGAGKTTTLSYALLMFAQNKARHGFNIAEELLPVFIALRRLSGSDHSIAEDLISEKTQILAKDLIRECPKSYFEKKLKKGECIVLLDGLDEVTDNATHRQIAQKINNLAANYPGNRFVVTCRVAGWKNLLSGFKVLETQDFSRDEIQRFVQGWHRAIITQAEQSKLEFDFPEKKRFEVKWKEHKENVVRIAIDMQSRKLLEAIDRNNRILAIAVNPMLLSLIALVHYNRAILPKGRTILYSQCIELLIDAWDRTRDITSTMEISADQKEAVLREIAFEFQRKGKSEDSREKLEGFIGEIASKTGITIPAQQLLRNIEARSGLLIERSIDVLGFSHLTLQEYLVAKHIQLTADHYHYLTENFDNQEWREAVLLYAGLLDDATPLIRKTASVNSFERLALAGYCVGDAKHCSPEVSEAIIANILQKLKTDTEHRDALRNILSAIAVDYKETAITVEQKLSQHFVAMIQPDENIPNQADLLDAIAILGKARVTYALPLLVNLISHEEEAIRNETVNALIAFGNLALPILEQCILELLDSESLSIFSAAINEVLYGEVIKSLPDILAGINTGLSAKLLLTLYKLDNRDTDLMISMTLSQMLENPFNESDLNELEPVALVRRLQDIKPDKNGWPYKNIPAKPAFLAVDAKLREDIATFMDDAIRGVDGRDEIPPLATQLDTISFKVLFPSFLAHIRRMEEKPFSSDLAEAVGFTVSEDYDKIQFLSARIKNNPSLTLEYALQNIGPDLSAEDYAFKEITEIKLLKDIANAYFVLFTIWNIFLGIIFQLVYLGSDISNIGRYTDLTYLSQFDYKYTIIAGSLFLLFYIFVITYTKIKLKRKFFDKRIVGILFCPLANFLKILPYIGKMNIWIKWILFVVLFSSLSPFFGLTFDGIMSSSEQFRLFSLAVIPLLTFGLLSFLYLKYYVLKENPIYHLLLLHPKGRKVLRGQ